MNKILQQILIKNDLIDSSGKLVRGDEGKLLKCISIGMDELEERHAKMEERKEKLKVILDTTPSTVSWLNKDMTYGGVNQALADLTQLEPSDFEGKTIGFYTENKYFYNFAKAMFDSKAPFIHQQLSTEIDGKEKQFWVTGTKFDQDRQGLVIGIDITELNNMREHVALTEKLSQLGEMVASIIHEVNNPLTLIRMQGQRLKKLVAKGDIEKIIESSEKIVRTSDKISQIIRGVQSFVRQGEDDPKQVVGLRGIIDDAIVILEGRLKDNNITMEIAPCEDIQMNINVTQVFQVFVNLITNGIDGIEGLENKWLRVEWENESDKVVIRFSDSGNGIPMEVQKGMWDSFFTTKGVGKGSGLGLSLCRKIMDKHEGKIFIDNESENTTFVIEFPVL